MKGRYNREFVADIRFKRIPHEKAISCKTPGLVENETNDCVVRSVAAVTDGDYARSHEFLKNVCGRKNRRGTPWWEVTTKPAGLKAFREFYGAKLLDRGDIRIILKSVYHWQGNFQPFRPRTVGQLLKYFQKTNEKGKFLVEVKGHVFAIIEGRVCGNIEDTMKLKRPIQSLHEVRPIFNKN